MTTGLYRRLYILPFEMNITKEQERNFDKSKILNQNALDYLFNTAIREFLKIADSKQLANEAESNKFVNEYRTTHNSAMVFLGDELTIEEIFSNSNKIPTKVFYGQYVGWCKENDFKPFSKQDFYKAVLERNEYIKVKVNGGYDGFKNTNIADKGTKGEFETF